MRRRSSAQADTNLSLASQVTVSIGGPTANLQALMGDFNEAYYNGVSGQSLLYVVGNDGSANRVPALYAIGFDSSFKLNPTYSNGPLAARAKRGGTSARRPMTAFFNSSLNKQFLFVGVSGSCSTIDRRRLHPIAGRDQQRVPDGGDGEQRRPGGDGRHDVDQRGQHELERGRRECLLHDVDGEDPRQGDSGRPAVRLSRVTTIARS